MWRKAQLETEMCEAAEVVLSLTSYAQDYLTIRQRAWAGGVLTELMASYITNKATGLAIVLNMLSPVECTMAGSLSLRRLHTTKVLESTSFTHCGTCCVRKSL